MQKLANFLGNVCKFCTKFDDILLKFCEWSGAKEYQSDRSRQELSNKFLIAKIGFDTAENEPLKPLANIFPMFIEVTSNPSRKQ